MHLKAIAIDIPKQHNTNIVPAPLRLQFADKKNHKYLKLLRTDSAHPTPNRLEMQKMSFFYLHYGTNLAR